MKILKLLVVSAFILTSFGVNAATQSFTYAQTIAKRTLNNSVKVSLASAKTEGRDTLYYVFTGNAGGYAIVSAGSETPALLGYSKEGDMNSMPEQLGTVLNAYTPTAHAQETGSAFGLKATRITGKAIEPLLGEITWNQTWPYYNKTPKIDGYRTPTGCAATAMAQIMYYYRYPNEVQEDIPSYTTRSSKITIPAIKKGTKIDWDNMHDDYDFQLYDYTEEETDAVANLMIIAGTATSMDYNDASGAHTEDISKALVEYLGYDPDLVRCESRRHYNFKEWNNLIYNELESKRPVILSGAPIEGNGHAFVCDGIDDNGLFHINWGWGGAYNGYFDLALLNPWGYGACKTESGQLGDGYSGSVQMICGIAPDNGVKDSKEPEPEVHTTFVKSTSWCYFQFSFQKDAPATLTFMFENVSGQDIETRLALGFINDNGEVVIVSLMNWETLAAGELGAGMFEVWGDDMEEGKTYKLVLIESNDYGDTFTPCDGADEIYAFVQLENGIPKYKNMMGLTADAEIKENEEGGRYLQGVAHFYNSGPGEYYDKLFIYTNSTNELPSSYTCGTTITAEIGETSDLDFVFFPEGDTTYYWLVDIDKNIIFQGVWIKGLGGVTNQKAETFMKVWAEPSALVVEAKTAFPLTVTDIAGRKVFSKQLSASETYRISLPAGVYIANGKKVLIH